MSYYILKLEELDSAQWAKRVIPDVHFLGEDKLRMYIQSLLLGIESQHNEIAEETRAEFEKTHGKLLF